MGRGGVGGGRSVYTHTFIYLRSPPPPPPPPRPETISCDLAFAFLTKNYYMKGIFCPFRSCISWYGYSAARRFNPCVVDRYNGRHFFCVRVCACPTSSQKNRGLEMEKKKKERREREKNIYKNRFQFLKRLRLLVAIGILAR